MAVLALVACRERQVPVLVDAAVPVDAGSLAASVVQAPGRPVHIMNPPAPSSFVRIADDLGRAVVNLRTVGEVTGGPASIYPNARPDPSLGSGFIVDRDARLVLTAHHIVADASALRVVLVGGEEREATLVGRAPHLDIALVRIEGKPLPEDVPALRMAESDGLRVGEWVVALGNPFGGEVTASAGIVSSVGRATSLYEPPEERFRGLIHTDAAIHRGNAGGPLVNLAGEAVGITTVVGRDMPLGLVIPMSQVLRVFDELRRGQVAETWLGMFVLPVDAERAGACGARGVEVTQVVPVGPADKAGLRAGDVIVRFDGRDVDAPRLAALSRATVAGQRIDIVVCRGGSELTRVIVPEEKPR